MIGKENAMRKILLAVGLVVLTTPALAGGSETAENGVTVVRGGNSTLAETMENDVMVVRGSTDYPVREVVVEKEAEPNPSVQFFEAYDQWRRSVIHRKLHPKP